MKTGLAGLMFIWGLTLFSQAGLAAPCLQSGRIDDWRAIPGNRALIVTDVGHNKFKITLQGVCSDLQWHNTIGFVPFGRSRLSCLTRGDKITARGLEGPPVQSCPIEKVEAFTLEMEKTDVQTQHRP